VSTDFKTTSEVSALADQPISSISTQAVGGEEVIAGEVIVYFVVFFVFFPDRGGDIESQSERECRVLVPASKNRVRPHVCRFVFGPR